MRHDLRELIGAALADVTNDPGNDELFLFEVEEADPATPPQAGEGGATPVKTDSTTRKKCEGRIPGNILTNRPCWNYARPGTNYCYWHDPEKGPERMERARKQAEDRRLEREQREARK